LHLVYAIPNHPWIDSETSAAVRIAITVGEAGHGEGLLAVVAEEQTTGKDEADIRLIVRHGEIREDLRIGANVAGSRPLQANKNIAGTGLILGNRGFILTQQEADYFLTSFPESCRLVFPLRHGRDLTDVPRNVFVIDTYGWEEGTLRREFPAIYQRLRDRVFPERQQNRDPRLRRRWWLFRRSNEQIRDALRGLERYLATPETARHRVFMFLSSEIKPEHKLVVFGSDDALLLGLLSCRAHVCWALATGGRLGVGNDPVYSKNHCFDKFPFPTLREDQKRYI
jgi:hypothetical protein